ncbi:LysR family transcriptional regulator [Alcaligenaceae bacterium]|nr:LysR family transcriptional regulator [Alcaligenaceae bacterium]
MELRHLRYFMALAEELHFGRAARRLNISQPPLSQQIRALEDEISAKLFDRDNRNVSLTQAGRLFRVEVEDILKRVERAKLIAARAQRGEIGEIAVAMFPSALFIAAVAQIISEFRRSRPGVRLIFKEGPPMKALSEIHHGNVDIAFVRYRGKPPLPLGFTAREIIREPLLVCLRKDHPLAKDGSEIDIRQLAHEPIVHFPRHRNALCDQFIALCQDAGFEPRLEQEVTDNSTLLGLVAAGIGIAVLPASQSRLQLPETCVLPLRCSESESIIWCVHPLKPESALVDGLVALIP